MGREAGEGSVGPSRRRKMGKWEKGQKRRQVGEGKCRARQEMGKWVVRQERGKEVVEGM